jgi:hypothetical protein
MTFSSPPHAPTRLLSTLAKAWAGVAGGSVHILSCPAGDCVLWESPDGSREALPNRLYGVGDRLLEEVTSDAFPPDLAVNLPPGMTLAGAQPTCVTHVMVFSDLEQAWSSLRRVGRQGVEKAERLGCTTRKLSHAEYLRLAGLKAIAHGSPPMQISFLQAMQGHFEEQMGVIGVVFDGEPVAGILWVCVEGYGLLVDGASDRNHWDKNPNNLAVWAAITELCGHGARSIDYGFSPVGAGDSQFKDHMGGRRVELYRHAPVK